MTGQKSIKPSGTRSSSERARKHHPPHEAYGADEGHVVVRKLPAGMRNPNALPDYIYTPAARRRPANYFQGPRYKLPDPGKVPSIFGTPVSRKASVQYDAFGFPLPSARRTRYHRPGPDFDPLNMKKDRMKTSMKASSSSKGRVAAVSNKASSGVAYNAFGFPLADRVVRRPRFRPGSGFDPLQGRVLPGQPGYVPKSRRATTASSRASSSAVASSTVRSARSRSKK